MSRRTLILTLIVIVVLVVSGFYLRALMHRTFHELRPRPEQEMTTQLQQQALQADSTGQQTQDQFIADRS